MRYASARAARDFGKSAAESSDQTCRKQQPVCRLVVKKSKFRSYFFYFVWVLFGLVAIWRFSVSAVQRKNVIKVNDVLGQEQALSFLGSIIVDILRNCIWQGDFSPMTLPLGLSEF
jgi:hypothetical protein